MQMFLKHTLVCCLEEGQTRLSSENRSGQNQSRVQVQVQVQVRNLERVQV